MEIFIPILGGIVYFLVTALKKQSPTEERPYKNRDPLNEPFEEIRREILRKKKDRESLKPREVELAMEAEKASYSEAKESTKKIGGPSQFQMQIEEQSLIIKKKHEEAERLKANLKQMNKEPLKKKVLGCHNSNNRAILLRGKIKSLLSKRSNIKPTLIAGEILAGPLSLRKDTNY